MRLLRAPFDHFPKWKARYGDPFLLPTVNGKVVITGEPDLIKTIFSAPPEIYDAFAPEAAGALVGRQSILTTQGEKHKRDRKLMTPPLHGARMRAYGETMRTAARRHIAPLSRGARFVAMRVAQDVSLDVIIATVFGATDEAEVERFSHAIRDTIDRAHPAFLFVPALQRELGGFGPFARYKRALARLHALFDARIANVRDVAEGREDVLALLLSARYEDDSRMPDDELKSQLHALLAAGHETTGIGLSWALYFLHRNPATLERLRAELDTQGDDEPAAELAKLPYLEAVCKEALRLFPIVTEVLRLLNAPLVLGDYEVPAGHSVSPSVLLAHYREEVFEAPHEFRPERFLDRRYSPFEYLPFGGGHRRCIGAAFASYEMAIVLGTWLKELDLELLDGEVPPVRRNITMAPKGGVHFEVRQRNARPIPR